MNGMDTHKKIKVIIKSYYILVSTLPISSDNILNKLFNNKVITATTLQVIRLEPLDQQKVEILLDTVLRSLKVGIGELYDKMAEVLKGSDDPTAQCLGGKLQDGIITESRQLHFTFG